MTQFNTQYHDLLRGIFNRGRQVEVGEWQSQDVRNNPEMISRELRHVTFRVDIPDSMEKLQAELGSTLSLPWAEDHFQERVCGKPLNPPPSEAWWPYARQGNAEHKVDGQKFHHTYPERIWPCYAGDKESNIDSEMWGIRYEYGDLSDVANQLRRNPLTRQAYLPIWFPEDTGANGVPGQRVPCTLGYHFLFRPDRADIVYYIRSCDILRHFTDDVYMAGRLLQWMCDEVFGGPVLPMELVMHISSLHYFRGDHDLVKYKILEFMRSEEEEEYGAGI